MMSFDKKTVKSSQGGFYEFLPLSKFKDSGEDWVAVANWLRLCPFNETTQRWHIPMKNDKSEGIYWNIYSWMRKNEADYQYKINKIMGENRGLFVDTAQQNHQKDFWLVADEFRRVDKNLFSARETDSIKYAPNFHQSARNEDLMLPDFRGKWIYDVERRAGGKTIDAELRAALDLAYQAMESLAAKSRCMKEVKI